MIPEQYSKTTSYSRYRGLSGEYALSDEYFARVVDGNLICTDTECDIDCDGNIVLCTPAFEVIHIGKMPLPERGDVRVSFDSNNNLHLCYTEYLANGFKHPRPVEMIVDTHLTPERKRQLMLIRLAKFLKTRIKGYCGGSFRNSITIDFTDSCVILDGTCKQISRFGSKSSECSQRIEFRQGVGFVLIPSRVGGDPIFTVIRNYTLLKHLNVFNLSIGLGKETPFYVTSIGEDCCTIKDLTDGVSERMNLDMVYSYIEKGILSVVGIDCIDGVWVTRRVES